LDIDDLLIAQRRADINAYIRLPSRFHFHHKAIELMAAQKPIICYPTEVDETIEIIRRVGGILYSCGSIEDVSLGFDAAYKKPNAKNINSKLSEYSWQSQANALEKIFERTMYSS
jgi:glycosyltransferase involved in cell wall biosynthesis